LIMKPDETDKLENDTSSLIGRLSSLGPLSNSGRAGILIVLLGLKRATFTDILVAVKTSKSSLSTSLSILERSGYVRTEYGFFRRGGPRTIIVITKEGEEAIIEYLNIMGKITQIAFDKNMK